VLHVHEASFDPEGAVLDIMCVDPDPGHWMVFQSHHASLVGSPTGIAHNWHLPHL